MNEVFANTGIQLLFYRVARSISDIDLVGHGWQTCRLRQGAESKTLSWVQWRYEISPPRVFLAVDTTLGPENNGYFADPATFTEERREVRLEGLLDAAGRGLLDFGGALDAEDRPSPGPLVFAVRVRGDGEPREVHLAVDFGNNRTGALLLELTGALNRDASMMPLELVNRYRLDAWDHVGNLVPRPRSRWFTSQTHWCAAPFLEPPHQTYEVVRPVEKKGMFGVTTEYIKEKVRAKPALFLEHSLVRMGHEGADVIGAIWGEDRPTTGVSSPKRYLWADDGGWLEGANWHMADPFDRHAAGNQHVAMLQGGLLKYFSPQDDDSVLGTGPWTKERENPTAPTAPQFPPRTLMTAALYEMICQAYALINSVSYRRRMGDPRRLRRLASLGLSFPSGMIAPERQRLELQAKKACKIFDMTAGRSQGRPVTAHLAVDEASAVHLTYIWSELQLIDFRPDFWFAVAGRHRVGPDGRGPNQPEVRIACIDIGGGTTDLMIAKYTYDIGPAHRRIHGEVLHRDGVTMAGDQMIKRMLERIIVPEFGRAVGLDLHQLNLLFGPEQVANRGLRVHRVDWVNRLFVPLAVAYLERAVTNSNEPISHTNLDIVSSDVVDSLQRVVNDKFGVGQVDVKLEMELRYDAAALEDLVGRVFQDLLFDFCGRIVKHDADIVLLAGQPTKLQVIQRLIQGYLPLTNARIVPMHNYYAGNNYPYQDEKGRDPGRIVDPKSAVVVGTAINHLARSGKLSQFDFKMHDPIRTESYYWGVINPQSIKIDEYSVVFPGDRDRKGKPTVEFPVRSEELILGRRLSPSPTAQPSPVYQLRCREEDPGEDQGIDVTVRLERYIDPDHKEELLRLLDVKGTVLGRPAEKDRNVQLKMLTLAHERYYLDSGALDNIAAP